MTKPSRHFRGRELFLEAPGAATSALGFVYAVSGKQHEALEVRANLKRQYQERKVSPYS